LKPNCMKLTYELNTSISKTKNSPIHTNTFIFK
jgi:hypothetical protein